ncbi:hypothetical protein [Lentzea sp. HUAS12]|uniref:hypothetical protein n=1 Tax=Lentzea sp. HUAS12 TaxID=2951806 RepID=UPI0020A08737|nr:hypothetical protein [Lentzea sp. HUAS12]USX54372.1 hypothetical protein ND450_09790 [Lentzea sp. HUAS12]
MIDSLGDVEKVIRQADPDEPQRVCEALNAEIVRNATGRTLDGSIRPVGRDEASVREGLEFPCAASLCSSRVPALLDSSKRVWGPVGVFRPLVVRDVGYSWNTTDQRTWLSAFAHSTTAGRLINEYESAAA